MGGGALPRSSTEAADLWTGRLSAEGASDERDESAAEAAGEEGDSRRTAGQQAGRTVEWQRARRREGALFGGEVQQVEEVMDAGDGPRERSRGLTLFLNGRRGEPGLTTLVWLCVVARMRASATRQVQRAAPNHGRLDPDLAPMSLLPGRHLTDTREELGGSREMRGWLAIQAGEPVEWPRGRRPRTRPQTRREGTTAAEEDDTTSRARGRRAAGRRGERAIGGGMGSK